MRMYNYVYMHMYNRYMFMRMYNYVYMYMQCAHVQQTRARRLQFVHLRCVRADHRR